VPPPQSRDAMETKVEPPSPSASLEKHSTPGSLNRDIDIQGDKRCTGRTARWTHLVDFFTSFEWWKTEPHDELVNNGA